MVPDAHDPDDPDEVARLREQVAHLQRELEHPGTAGADAPRGGRWRTAVVVLLLFLMALTAPLAVVATWARDEIGDTDRYVDTVAPLADDPAVQAAVTVRVSDELLTRLNVRAVTDQAVAALTDRGIPPGVAVSLKALSSPLANAIDSFVSRQVTSLVESDAFAQAWTEANRQAHDQMVAVLTGQGGPAVQVDDDAVRLNLAVIIDAVKGQLVDQGFALANRIPEVTAEFTLFESKDLTKARNGFRLLESVATVLPFVALVCLLGAVFLARRRRHTLVVASLVVAASMLALGLALNLFRSVYLGAVPTDQLPTDAAGAIYDRLVWFIRLNLRALLVLFLAVAAVAWVSGPGPAPSRLRSGTTRVLDSVRHRSDDAGLDTGPVGRFLGAYRNPIRGAVAGVVVLVYVLAAHPTGAFTIGLLLVGAAVLLLVELLAREPAGDLQPVEHRG